MNRVELIENFLLSMDRARTMLGYTQQQMADALDISVAQYKKLIAGERVKIDAYLLYKLHQVSGIPMQLLIGDVDPSTELMSNLAALSERQLRFIADVVLFESQMAGLSDGGIDMLTVMVPSGCVEDGMIWDSCALESVNAGKYLERYPEITCGLRITSNHLHPVYQMDDILLIARKPPRDGDVAVFVNRTTGRAYLRQFKQGEPCRLVSVNGYGKDFTVDPHNSADMNKWLKFGVVVSKMR